MQVLITGGTGGIGFAIASQFAADGHNVVIADLQQDAIDSKVQQLRQQAHDLQQLASCAALQGTCHPILLTLTSSMELEEHAFHSNT